MPPRVVRDQPLVLKLFYFFLYLSLSRLSLGTELVYQRQDGIQGAMLSVGGRYATDMWEGTARLGIHAWQLTYQHKLDENLIAMAEMDGNIMQVRRL